MGGVKIIVNPETHVSNSGMGMLGAFAMALPDEPLAEETQAHIHLSGFALMGGVEVVQARPGERLTSHPKRGRRRRRHALSDSDRKD